MNDEACPSRPGEPGTSHDASFLDALRGWLRRFRRNGDISARDTLEELIEEREEAEMPINADERRLLANILDLRDRDVRDVMVPRADIVAVEMETPYEDLIQLMIREEHSRIPVYHETLDDARGMVHIKDVVAWHGREAEFSLAQTMRPVLFVSPFMRVPDLLLEMRVKRCHMALVVDEFGGIDGLLTIEDLVEEIVGEIEDEHDIHDEPALIERAGGILDAEARVSLEDLEKLVGPFVSEEEREEVDTIGGLVFALAGRVPMRGELIGHPSGIEFEVVEADPRRVKRVRVRRPQIPGAAG
ncbi:hemolysin family protein [Shumkonia mesophila]|uniref:hemolysin family protein n=1 Tax=Shumkonia mesophila TaxID=2838854 RepID=UPI0029342B60|nr:hemolysin family protein [Shumkonia mesophila]